MPGPVITAFWALESDFGAGMGDLPVLRSLATLAYDCRRPDMFRGELMDALRIIDRGDLTPGEMIGSWAGELGQTQFLPSHYVKYAVDFDGDGRRNLLRSVPDVIASTANFIVSLGWQRGQPWLQEVKVPAQLPWDQADLTIQHPRSKWASWGVTSADGRSLAADTLPASLVLPMGRFGPAFLAYDNFQIYIKWNQSLNYCITAAHLAAQTRRSATIRPRQWSGSGVDISANERAAATAGPARSLGWRDRRQARRSNAGRCEERANEIGPSRQFLSHTRTCGASALWAVAQAVR